MCVLSGTSFARKYFADIGILLCLGKTNSWVKAERRSSFSVDNFVAIEVRREDVCSTSVINTVKTAFVCFLTGQLVCKY